jgi:hypothetical protein
MDRGVAPPPSFDDFRLQKLKDFCSSHEIKLENVMKLRKLEEFEIICVCDDSGSMGSFTDDQPSDPFGKKKTRWDELRETMNFILDLSTCLDKDGVDIFFLNRPPIMHVTSTSQIQVAFQTPPSGYTPTVKTLKYILQEKHAAVAEKKLLLILATDGQPTDDMGNVQLQEFIDYVKAKPKNVFLSIVACTDDEMSIDYLKGLVINKFPQVEVTDDYRSERKQVVAKTNKPFSFGDYICKIVLGPIEASSSGGGGGGAKASTNNAAKSNNPYSNNCYCCCFYCPC